ncbi:MAG: hypothetical protein AAFR17_06480 [Pseudomonadota bacterium]
MRAAALAVMLLAGCEPGSELDRTDLRAEDIQAVALRVFEEMCLQQLPTMAEVRPALLAVAEQELGEKPTLDRDAYSTVASRRAGMILTRGTPAWPAFEGEHRCEVQTNALPVEETTEAALDLFKAEGRAGFALTEARPDHIGERQAWTVAGTRPGMRFEVATGAAAEGGNRQVILRLAWRDG